MKKSNSEDTANPVKKSEKRFSAIAVIIGSVILAVTLILTVFSDSGESVILSDGTVVKFEPAAGEVISDMITEDIESRELSGQEISTLFSGLPVTAYGHFDAESGRLFGLEGKIGECSLITCVPDRWFKDTVIEGRESSSVIDGVSVKAGYLVTDKNSKGEQHIVYYAEFDLGENKYYLENGGDLNKKIDIRKELINRMTQLISNGEVDLAQIGY